MGGSGSSWETGAWMRRLFAVIANSMSSLQVWNIAWTLSTRWRRSKSIEAPSGSLTAPMPGRIVQLKISQGDRVKRGDTLLVLEAMKMEHSLLAPADGLVESIAFAAGDLVEEGVELLVLAIGGPRDAPA